MRVNFNQIHFVCATVSSTVPFAGHHLTQHVGIKVFSEERDGDKHGECGNLFFYSSGWCAPCLVWHNPNEANVCITQSPPDRTHRSASSITLLLLFRPTTTPPTPPTTLHTPSSLRKKKVERPVQSK
ncbi:hypothetical protein E2C01_020515 [Portunus trituberculatus]|uniref:Uncharacterized protein n=1 Tax=Portunus trituberculatus TaxID=210409 RepID=A0A5B7E2H9_PORTR|nr:hypothetical protein [Portunus trituberculatus]